MLELVNYLVLAIVLIVFTIASIEDIKKREVYDYLNFGFLFSIVIIGIVHSVFIGSFEPVKFVGIGLLCGFLLGTVLYYAGLWGGGDMKFLIGFGASSFYLIPFMTATSKFSEIYNFAVQQFEFIFGIIIGNLIFLIEIINIFAIFMIVYQYLRLKDKKEKRGCLYLLGLMLILTIGLFLKVDLIYLIFLGVIAFGIIFYFDEEIFMHIYFLKLKKISKLVEGDKTDSDILLKDKVIVEKRPFLGLNKQDLLEIKKHKFGKKEISIRKILPYGILVGLNFFLFILKVLISNISEISIFGFLFKFLFYSFIFGGIIAILLLFGFAIINFKKCKVKLSKIEKIIISSFILFGLILGIINFKFLIISFIGILYLFMKTAKSIEKIMFVKKKDISKLVPGDWISEDIKFDNKVIIAVEDCRLGLEEEQIERLVQLSKKHKEFISIKIRDGLAFLPPLFIGFLVMLFF